MHSARPGPRRHPMLIATALGIAMVSAPALCRAQDEDDKDACIDASEQGQKLRDKGKLHAAREAFLTCSREVCPPLVKTDCAGWLADVDARRPSVVVSAHDPQGRDTAEVRVTLDGTLLSPSLDGRAIPVDPGEHVFRYERAGSPPVEQRVILREGEQRRVLEVRFQSQPRPPEQPATASADGVTNGVPAGVFVLSGVGALGVGLFVGLGLSARSDVDDLRATCAPNCAEDDVEAARAKAIAANVSLGAGVLALGAAAVVFFTRPRATPRPPAVATLNLAPVTGGFVFGMSGHF